MDVLGPDRDVRIRLGQGVADRGEADERRADDPGHAAPRASAPRSSGRARRHRPGSCASSSCAATITSRIAANHARAGCGGRTRPALGLDRRPGARAARARAGRPSDGSRAVRPARRGSPRASRGAPRRRSRTTYGCAGSRPSASSVAIASSWRPAALTARWRLADSALSTRLSSPRSARETCRASSSSSAPVAPIRRRNVPTASPLFEVTTPRPRRSRHDAGSPNSARRAASSGASSGCDDELEVGPAAGEAERAAGQEPAAQPGAAAVLRGGAASRSGRAGLPLARAAAAGWRAAPTDASRPIGVGPEPGDLGDPVARPRRVDGGQLVAQRGDEVALGAGHVRPVRRRRSGRRRPAPDPGLALERADDRGGEPDRVVVVGVGRVDDVVEDRVAGPAATTGGQRRRTPSAAPPSPRRHPRRSSRQTWLLARTMSTSVRAGVRDERLDVRRRGRTRSSRRPGSRRCRRRSAARRRAQDRVADGRDQEARQEARVQAARAEDDELGVGDRGQRVLGRARRRSGVSQTRSMPAGPHDLRLAVDDRAVGQPGVERQRRRRHRHDLAADGEDPVHQPDAVLEVAALDRGHRRDQQVAEGVAGRGPLGRRRPSVAGKRYWRTSLISGSASASADDAVADVADRRDPELARAARRTSRRRRPRSRSRSGCWCAP